MNNKICTGMAIVGITEKMFLDVASYIAVISDMVIKNNCPHIAPELIQGLRKATETSVNGISNVEAKRVLTKYIESFIGLIESGIKDIKELMEESLLEYDNALEEMNTYFIGLCQ